MQETSRRIVRLLDRAGGGAVVVEAARGWVLPPVWLGDALYGGVDGVTSACVCPSATLFKEQCRDGAKGRIGSTR